MTAARRWGGGGVCASYLELVVQALVALGQRATLLHGVDQVVGRVGEVAAAARRLGARVGARVALRALRAGLRHVVVLRRGGRRQQRRRLVLQPHTTHFTTLSSSIIC